MELGNLGGSGVKPLGKPSIELIVEDDILEYVGWDKTDIEWSPFEGCLLDYTPNGFKSHFSVRYKDPNLNIDRKLGQDEWELYAYDVRQDRVTLGARYNGLETHDENLDFALFPITRTEWKANGLEYIEVGESLMEHFDGYKSVVTGKAFYQQGSKVYEVPSEHFALIISVSVSGVVDISSADFNFGMYESGTTFTISYQLLVSERGEGEATFLFKLKNQTFKILENSYPKNVYWKEGFTDFSSIIEGMKSEFHCGNFTKDTTSVSTKRHYPEIALNESVNYTIEFQYAVNQDVYIATATITGQPNTPYGISPNGVDDENYTDSWVGKFKLPNFTFSLIYQDGTVLELQPTDSRLSYYADELHTIRLVPDQSEFKNVEEVYVRFNESGTDQIAATSYRIVPKKDVVVDLVLEASPSLVMGTLPTQYQFSFKATYLSGITQEGWKNYSIANEADYIVSTTPEITFIDKADGFYKSFSFTASKPTSSVVSVKQLGDLKLALNNNKDSIDCRKTVWQIEYFNNDEKLPYVAEIQFEDIVYSSTKEGVNFFDGSEKLNVQMEGGVASYFDIVATFNDVLMGASASGKITLCALAISNVNHIRAGNAIEGEPYCFRTSYYAGETFLNDDDDSNVNVGFVNADGQISEENFFLRSSSNVLNITPVKGTVLKEGTYNVIVSSIFNSSVYIQYSINVRRKKDYEDENQRINLKPYRLTNNIQLKKGDYPSFILFAGTYVLVESKYLAWQEGKAVLLGTLETDRDKGIEVHGYLKNVNSKEANSSVILFDDYIPQIEGESNIICKFPCYDAKQSDFVNKCRFGIRFGHNNSLNCLFLSGNPDKPNYDIHSSQPNWENRLDGDAQYVRQTAGDYSYFPDEAIQKYGEDENAIVGYDIVSDSKLLVLKNKKGNERTVYFRTPKLVTATSATGEQMLGINGEYLYQQEYQTSMSNSPIGGISPSTIGNFNGDTIFLSDQGRIEGLNIEGIIGDSQRQATTRSFYVDKELFSETSEKPLMYISGPYCFFDNGKNMYVSHKDEKSDSQYEWWKVDSPKANCFYSDENGNVYVGTEQGELKVFKKDSYSDVDRIFLSYDKGEYKVSNGMNGSIKVPDSIASLIDETWVFRHDRQTVLKNNFFHLIASVRDNTGVHVKGDKLFVDDEYYSPLFAEIVNNSLKCYVCRDIVGGIALNGTAYGLYKSYSPIHFERDYSDLENASYFIYGEDGNKIVFNNDEFFGICVVMEGEYKISKIKDGYIYLVDSNNIPLHVVPMYETASASYRGMLLKKTPVVSEFVTAPFLIDSANYNKTIHKLDIINASKEPNDLSVCQVSYGNETQKDPRYVYSTFPSSNPTFDFGKMDFAQSSFSKNISPRVFTIPRYQPVKRYFSLAFQSNNDKNSVLPGVEITYSYHRLAKGKSE